MVKLFIGGLSDNIQEMDLAIFVSLHGRVETIKVVRDRATKKCKGYAFLEIFTLQDAKNIITNLNGETFKGNTITVKLCEDEPAKKPGITNPSKPSVGKRPRLSR